MLAWLHELRRLAYVGSWEARDRTVPFGMRAATRLLLDSQRWPRAELDALRDRKVRTLVARVWDAIPAYRRTMEERGVRPADFQGVADLARLPVLTKERLHNEADSLRARDLPDAAVEVGQTGGTTGVPIKVVRNLSGTIWQKASYWRGFHWGGLELGAPWAQLFGGSLGLASVRSHNGIRNWVAGKVFLPAFELGTENVAEYVRAIRRGGARFLVGYASACHELARLVERQGLSLPLTAVFPTSELMAPQWGERMARVFGARVMPYYGSGEVQSLGYSCPDVAGTYHTCDEHVVLEVERPDGTIARSGEGAFLVTDLDNHAMPIIRYRNGDAGLLAEEGCACGRSLGRILRLDGRVPELLVTSAGDRVSGIIAPHAFRLFPEVDAFQVVQRRPGHALLRIVRGAGYDAVTVEPKLREVFRGHLGAEAEVELEYASAIPRTAAGKVRMVVNDFLAANPG